MAIDASGTTTIAAAGNIISDGAVTFGAALGGALNASADITTSDDNVTFTNAVTLGDAVSVDTTGSAAGNILASSTIALGANNLTLDAGATGNIMLAGTVGGTGAVNVTDGGGQVVALTREFDSGTRVHFDLARNSGNITWAEWPS